MDQLFNLVGDDIPTGHGELALGGGDLEPSFGAGDPERPFFDVEPCLPSASPSSLGGMLDALGSENFETKSKSAFANFKLSASPSYSSLR